MKIKNIISSLVVLSSISFANDYFVELNYGYYDGKAKSTSNSADDKTTFPSIELGMKSKNINYYISYDQIDWEDAKAQDVMLNIDYVIPSGSFEYFFGVGVGKMKYEVDDIFAEADKKNVASLKVGINYELSKTFYLSSALRYLYTNDIEVRDTVNSVYSTLDNMFGVQVGIGVIF